MKPRISDKERAEKVRQWARQASARRRERLTADGKEQLLCWIPGAIRQQLDSLANENNQSVSDTVCNLLSLALTTPPDLGRHPMLDHPPAPPTERDQRILELHGQGINNVKIGELLGCSEGSVRRALKRVQKEVTA